MLHARFLHAAICAALSGAAFAAPEPAIDAAGAGHAKKPERLPRVEVVGSLDQLARQPGSATVLDQRELESSRVLTVNEALRKVPGIHVRDEEGFGMRPNIGVRGLNPSRSTKVLLLEDGIPAMYGPYGSNESYYHPPIDRYARIEVLKGVGMLRFGPQTIGGVVNYITPDPPQRAGGYAQFMAGSRDYLNAHLNFGGRGALLDVIQKSGDGARDNTRLRQTDINAKYTADVGGLGAITFRANRMDEDSDVGYTGVTDAELANFGRAYNPFRNDHFDTRHYGVSLTHEVALWGAALLTTNVYYYEFNRDWFRQSSTTSDTQCGSSFRDARFRGAAVDPNACNSRQGRLRDYYTRGIEPRLTAWHGLFGAENEFEAGIRFHAEAQQRLQVNATSPTGTTGTLVENNRRTVNAFSAFVQNRATWGNFSVIPVVRLESIDYARRDKLTGREGAEQLRQVIPGLGFNYVRSRGLTFFAGVHKGFAPPRVEDVIDNSGGSVNVDAEQSTNAELGVRGRFGAEFSYEAVAFRNDFSNQVAVGSIAGGSTPLAQGATQYAGFELAAQWERDGAFGWSGTPYVSIAATWLPIATQQSPLRAVVGGAIVAGSAAGNRLPYAPRGLASLRVGYRRGSWDGSLELQAADDQFADFGNTELPVTNGSGQVGRIAGYAVWNLALNYRPSEDGFSAFAAVKNAGDREYIVDRTRGILLGNPLQFVAGVRYGW